MQQQQQQRYCVRKKLTNNCSNTIENQPVQKNISKKNQPPAFYIREYKQEMKKVSRLYVCDYKLAYACVHVYV